MYISVSISTPTAPLEICISLTLALSSSNDIFKLDNLLNVSCHGYFCKPQTIKIDVFAPCFSRATINYTWVINAEMALSWNDKITNNWRQSYMNTFADWIGNQLWLGLNDLAVEGEFRWEHDGAAPIFTAWWTDQPNGDNLHNCVIVNRFFLWNDLSCSEDDMKRICEYWTFCPTATFLKLSTLLQFSPAIYESC